MTLTRNRHPENHKPLPQLRRRRLVRLRISSNPAIVAIDFRETILAVQRQMDLHRRAAHFRNRIFNMRQCVFVHGLHYRKSHLRYRVCGHLFWKSHHQRKHGSAREETALHLYRHEHVRLRRYSGTAAWRGLHGLGKVDMAVLFLGEST